MGLWSLSRWTTREVPRVPRLPLTAWEVGGGACEPRSLRLKVAISLAAVLGARVVAVRGTEGPGAAATASLEINPLGAQPVMPQDSSHGASPSLPPGPTGGSPVATATSLLGLHSCVPPPPRHALSRGQCNQGSVTAALQDHPSSGARTGSRGLCCDCLAAQLHPVPPASAVLRVHLASLPYRCP